MKRISNIVGLVFLFSVSSSGWSACPDGYKENTRSGECQPISKYELNQKSLSESTSTVSSETSVGQGACPSGQEPNSRSGECTRIPKLRLIQNSSSGSTSTGQSSGWVYCATAQAVSLESESWCSSKGGKAYTFKNQAQAEHNRLKTSSSGSTATASSYIGSPISFDFQNISVRGALQAIAEETDIRFVISDSVTGDLTLRLKEVPWDQALEAIMQIKGLAKRQKDNVVWIAPADEIPENERLSLESSSPIASSFDKVWCATNAIVFETNNSACNKISGKSFSSEQNAKAEHKRLKAASSKTSTTTQTAQTTATQPSAVDESALELAFWQTIQDSDDPDMFREYLRQFPQGVYAGLAKLKVKKLGGDTSSVAKASIPNLDYGDYYALVIGNNRYDHLSHLRTAVNDARSVANLLELDYGFNVTTLENANRDQIINSISGLRSKVTSQDNVLIYYAGHGVLDEDADEGYWLPVDASRDNPANWVMTDQVISQVRAMKAKHVMVVADSCFSGTITRGIKIEQRTPEWLETIVKKKARTALTSGGLEPVMDSGGGQNSVFANSFLSILRDNDGVLDASQLFSQLRPKVMVNSDQTPEYGDIHRAGHDGGDFLFVRQ